MITQGPCPLADLIPRRVTHRHHRPQQLITDFAGVLGWSPFRILANAAACAGRDYSASRSARSVASWVASAAPMRW
jgi:hypothetical protein